MPIRPWLELGLILTVIACEQGKRPLGYWVLIVGASILVYGRRPDVKGEVGPSWY